MRPIASNLTAQICKMLIDGSSHREIARKLGISVGTVSNCRSKLEVETIPKNRSGPKPLLSSYLRRKIVRDIATGVEENAVSVQRTLLRENNISVSAETVRRALRNVGMKGRAKLKKPLLTDRHKKLRLDFAKKYKNYTVEDWAGVVFSDEAKINRLGSDGREWTWRKVTEPLHKRMVKQTVKFGGGNVMLWGCMRSEGVGLCQRIIGRMTANGYIDVLQNSLIGSLEKWGKNASEIIFQHDNDPKHTARIVKSWIEEHGIELLDWPPQSPDLNPIEHLWQHLKRKVVKYPTLPKNLDELFARVAKEWSQIPSEVCRDLVYSMPRRIQAVLKARGGHTKY